MDREANLPVPPPVGSKNLAHPAINSDTPSSYSTPERIRQVRAALKRHRPMANMQPKRSLLPRRGVSRSYDSDVDISVDTRRSQDVVSLSRGLEVNTSTDQSKNVVAAYGESQDDASSTPPSSSGTITNTFDESFNPYELQRDCPKPLIGHKDNNPTSLSHIKSQQDVARRKVHFSTGNNASSQELQWDANDQVEASTVVNNDSKHRHFGNTESDINVRADGGMSSSLAKRTTVVQDQLHQFRNFLGQPATQFSVVGSSCTTSTYINSTSAPMLNSTTYCSRSHRDGNTHGASEPVGGFNLKPEPLNQGDMTRPSCASRKDTSGILVDGTGIAAQTSTSIAETKVEANEHEFSKEQQCSMVKESGIQKDPPPHDDNSMEGRPPAGNTTDVQSQAPLSKNSSLDVKLETSEPEKQENHVSGKVPRKRAYDPELFFKVNGKLYQKLGKIGSGGSSEVHKVISANCTIYALKKIKLKGRDYATAYGFCQEIHYLNKLKGKNNIIQLIDFEVTDKTLLQEVLDESMNNKDGKVKDDGYIYMVLEYGEIDLAHMLSQKWKEMNGSNQTIDENWLRFYWQQILQAVNTIHEERIVHSDLKPANFLLVKGFLKLIDFGIAKAIMSDTTNIQRDSQVGTLSYMSPEAFMCNETDTNGNVIKCGRPSDIWSLGCILYQMVYGRTPFAEYKTFWAKFKVITDPNHEIAYEPVPNPWLIDLMKKCLAWDRNERWRIPQLLQHPFLVPPIPSNPSSSREESYQLLQILSEACAGNQEASMLCCQLNRLLNPVKPITCQLSTSRDQQCKLLSEMSKVCLELQARLASQGENR